jgi:hypothetical protein
VFSNFTEAVSTQAQGRSRSDLESISIDAAALFAERLSIELRSLDQAHQTGAGSVLSAESKAHLSGPRMEPMARLWALLTVVVFLVALYPSSVSAFSKSGPAVQTKQSVLYSTIWKEGSGPALFKKFNERFAPKVKDETKSETEKLVEYVDYKPWRAPKTKVLNIHYKPQTESYQERYRREDDDTIYMYSQQSFRLGWDKTRVDDIWQFPYYWTKVQLVSSSARMALF